MCLGDESLACEEYTCRVVTIAILLKCCETLPHVLVKPSCTAAAQFYRLRTVLCACQRSFGLARTWRCACTDSMHAHRYCLVNTSVLVDGSVTVTRAAYAVVVAVQTLRIVLLLHLVTLLLTH
jgi:hypothetical protein